MSLEREKRTVRLAEKLAREGDLSDGELLELIRDRNEASARCLRRLAGEARDRVYGKKIYIRGLIEFTNYCRNNCFYCGIRRGNEKAVRYRLKEEEILECCREGFELGFRTFVLQGGEDPWYNDERLEHLVRAVRREFPDCAITLSVGERSRESYERLFAAGVDRYLLRHETAVKSHYEMLHPAEMSFDHRMQCLRDLKDIGYQTGCGMMVQSPGQTEEDLVADLRFMKEFRPHMIGIGPFLSHKDTPFKEEKSGTAELTVYLLSIIRLMLPEVLLPATTALGTAEEGGRKLGVLAGANVVMPNLSPAGVRKKYMLYDNKLSGGSEAAEHLDLLREEMGSIGFEVAVDRGDSRMDG
ncbi:MAG TPA: [FeFe] hydrogenase H-cluster radical SAM maturase HydE [Candidatus Lachnoclostridium pullistercoris]|uniref:[FeFe] hydrogenase H-cluster radical SAM maturase HydE n=1 Tax=Candidatus Lachnoclostridium pullistercoris TaxID=2838632 RepID=A0A9D2PA76_9FIRM|nr:[FeFe] hydrogenase H-cluster radical SAM maturase HydE [Candidatus Lachnoclostridium pullistercoris]